jgi:hypothetical protein
MKSKRLAQRASDCVIGTATNPHLLPIFFDKAQYRGQVGNRAANEIRSPIGRNEQQPQSPGRSRVAKLGGQGLAKHGVVGSMSPCGNPHDRSSARRSVSVATGFSVRWLRGFHGLSDEVYNSHRLYILCSVIFRPCASGS